jgi:hypothetical protein
MNKRGRMRAQNRAILLPELARKTVRFKVKSVGEPLGIFVLKILLLLQMVGTLLTLTPRILPVHSAYFIFVIHHDRTTQIVSTIGSFFCVAWFYALHQKLPIAWFIGWVVWSGSFLVLMTFSVRSVLNQTPGLGGWVATCIVGAGFLAIAVYTGRWWKHQKEFFHG